MEIAACDDNKLFLAELEEQLRRIPLVDNIFLYSDLDSFLFSIDGGKRYDAVLMDIVWDNGGAGINVASELYRLSPETRIIYITGYVEKFSQQIFLNRANLSGFLTKPVEMELLQANLQKVADSLSHQEQPSLILRQFGSHVSVSLREIQYIESMAHTIAVHTSDETVTVYDKLSSLLCALPENFCQCHRSYIVNMLQIRRIQPDGITLKNGDCIPVSRARYADTRNAYFTYMGHEL